MPEKSIESEYNKYKDDVSETKQVVTVTDSPCKNCPNEHKNKEICAEYCERLKAFQYNKSYRHLPYYPETPKSAQIANALPETPKTVTPRTQETSWKKSIAKRRMVQKPKPTIPAPLTYAEKMKIVRETTVCLNCGRDAKKYPLRRGLCLARCSGAWRDGRVAHKVLGVWKKMTKEEVHEARWGRYEECLIDGCTEIGDRLELCRKHYKQWHDGRIEKPGVGKWFPKSKKKEITMSEEQAKYEINLKAKDEEAGDGTRQEKVVSRGLMPGAKQEKLILHSVLLNFTGYPELEKIIKEISKLQHLPVNHVILNQIATGIMYGEDKAAKKKRRRENEKSN